LFFPTLSWETKIGFKKNKKNRL